jgi:glycerol-3-phosphate dehydrogenase
MLAQLPETPSATLHLHIHGFHKSSEKFENLAVYGSDSLGIQSLIQKDPSLGLPLHPALPYCGAEVVWATRLEMARTVEDVLARRTRALFLNARAASEMASLVASIMSRELHQDAQWQADQIKAFQKVAENYTLR